MNRQCSDCTFLNPSKSTKKCAMCDATRPVTAQSSVSSSIAVPSPSPGTWKEYRGKYLSGYASGIKTLVFNSLKEAQDAACKDATATSLKSGVGGITFERPNRFTLRAGTKLENSPSGEISWIFEPAATVPLKCRCCNKFEVITTLNTFLMHHVSFS
jgi:hypothetical protein